MQCSHIKFKKVKEKVKNKAYLQKTKGKMVYVQLSYIPTEEINLLSTAH